MKTFAQLARRGGRKPPARPARPGQRMPLPVAVATVTGGDRSGRKHSEFRSSPDNRQLITDSTKDESVLVAVATGVDNRAAIGAFTLVELLIVTGIVALLMALVIPAFTNIKSGGDVTNAAYTIKGVLDTARTYAKANDTYTWIGFFEEDVSQQSTNPATAGTGRIVMSIVASKDGTTVYSPSSPATIDPTKLIQVGKLTKIENAHLAGDTLFTTTPSTPTGSTFDNRPPVTYRIASPPNASPPNSRTPFQYPVGSPAPAAQYTFVKAVQFSPGGEARVDNNSDYTLQVAAEIGLRATHGTTVDTTSPNVVAIQFGGVGGNVTIYRK